MSGLLFCSNAYNQQKRIDYCRFQSADSAGAYKSVSCHEKGDSVRERVHEHNLLRHRCNAAQIQWIRAEKSCAGGVHGLPGRGRTQPLQDLYRVSGGYDGHNRVCNQGDDAACQGKQILRVVQVLQLQIRAG